MKGIYALVIRLDKDVAVNVGALGKIDFKTAFYVYIGSAQSNLEQRVKRHLRREKRLFWHVDYLLNSKAAKVTEVLFVEGKKMVECAVAKEISGRGEPVEGFGCSDCKCVSHLFRLSDYSFLRKRMKPLVLEP